jgi:hypothetical protein
MTGTGMYRRRPSLMARAVKPVLVLVFVLGIFGLVKMRAAIVSTEYDIGKLEKQKQELLVKRKAMQAEFSSQLSLKSIEASKLALVFPDRERVIYVRRDEGGMPYKASLRSK